MKELVYFLKRSFIVTSPAFFLQNCFGFIKKNSWLNSRDSLKNFSGLFDGNLRFWRERALIFLKTKFFVTSTVFFYSRILKVLFKKNSWLYSHDFLKKFWALLGDNLRLSGKELLYSLKRSFIVKSPAVFFQDCVGFIKRKIQLYS